MSPAVLQRSRERPALLNQLVLGVHENQTADDTAAERILRDLIDEFSPGIELERTSIGLKGRDAPWLFAGGSLFQGLERIKMFAQIVRETAR